MSWRWFGGLGLALCLVNMPVVARDEIVLSQAFFLQQALGPQATAQTLWLTPVSRAEAGRILETAHPPVRVRYWAGGPRQAWILESVGKHEPITAGFVVEAGRIVQVRVLVYRESRGGEVRREAFLRQFGGALPGRYAGLDRRVDGISGATLSVNAMTRMAHLALYLDDLRTHEAE